MHNWCSLCARGVAESTCFLQCKLQRNITVQLCKAQLQCKTTAFCTFRFACKLTSNLLYLFALQHTQAEVVSLWIFSLCCPCRSCSLFTYVRCKREPQSILLHTFRLQNERNHIYIYIYIYTRAVCAVSRIHVTSAMAHAHWHVEYICIGHFHCIWHRWCYPRRRTCLENTNATRAKKGATHDASLPIRSALLLCPRTRGATIDHHHRLFAARVGLGWQINGYTRQNKWHGWMRKSPKTQNTPSPWKSSLGSCTHVNLQKNMQKWNPFLRVGWMVSHHVPSQSFSKHHDMFGKCELARHVAVYTLHDQTCRFWMPRYHVFKSVSFKNCSDIGEENKKISSLCI